MKTFAIALAAALTLAAGAAQAAGNTSYTNGDGFVRGPVTQTLFGGSVLDVEPTASIGGHAVSGQVFSDQVFLNGREANIRYTVDADGSKNIISKSFASSGR